MKFKKLLSLLTASVMSAGCILQSGIANAMAEENESATETGDVSQDLQNPIDYETISGLQKFLSGEGNDDENSDLDMDKNGTVDVFDLTIARKNYKNEMLLEDFKADFSDILLNQEEVVTFTVNTRGTNILNETISLYDNLDTPVTVMHDDGKNGDKTADDGVYSAQLELVSDDFKNVDYYAATETCKSYPWRICFYREFTDEEIESFENLLKQIGELETMEEALNFFESSDEIASYYINEEDEIISYDSIYHISGSWETYKEGTFSRSGNAVDLDFSNSLTTNTLAEAEAVINSLKFTPMHPDKKDVILLLPYQEDELNPMFRSICSLVSKALDSKLTVKYFEDVSLEQMKNLGDYGVIMIFGHGGKCDIKVAEGVSYEMPITFIGQIYTKETISALSNDFAGERIKLGTDGHIAVTPLFYDKYYSEDDLKDSCWFLEGCYSMRNDYMCNSLRNKGAGVVFGYTNRTSGIYLSATAYETLINGLIISADNVYNSFSETIDIKGGSFLYNSEIKYSGVSSFKLVKEVKNDENFIKTKNETKIIVVNSETKVEDLVLDVDNYILLRKYKVNNLTKYELIGGKGDVVVPPFYEKVIIDKISGFSGKQLKSIVIPSTINELPKSAFASCKELEKVQLPSNLKKIGQFAFQYCESLKSINIPQGINEIGSSALSYTGLEEIELNLDNHFDDLYGLFTGCKELKKATINGSVEKLTFTFSECPSLESVELPSDLKKLESSFKGCTSLTEFTVPDGVEEINSYSFSFCTALEKVYMPDSITKIGQDAFSNCSKLYTVVMPKQLYSIGTRAFSGCRNLKDMHMPEVLYRIESQAFQNSSLGDFKIPDTVTYIGISAFSGCVNSRFYGLPANIKEICDEAFERCRFIYADNIFMKLTLPETLEKFEPTAFYNSDVDYLYILNPDMEFIVDNATNKSKLSYVLKYTKFFGYEGSTTQAFAEDPSHTCEFIAIGSENDFINKK